MEGRPLTKENMEQPNSCRTQRRGREPSGLDRVRQAAREDKELQFTALLHHVTVDLLRDSYQGLKKQAAAGVDGITWQAYGEDLEARLIGLHGRIHSGGLSGETIAESLHPQERREATTVGNRSAGRQDRTGRGREGS